MTYLSLLRGINVSGQKKIKMADLKALYESLGYARVVTYIQSGNVWFDAGNADAAALKVRLESAIADHFGFDVPVLIRTLPELEKVIADCPFGDIDVAEEGTRYLATLLGDAPDVAAIDKLRPFVHDSESLIVRDRVVYLHCPLGHGRSKLSNNLIENKLGVTATTRNWKTLCKLRDLATTR